MFTRTAVLRLLIVGLLVLPATILHANVPGGGTGTGPNVTLTDNGDGTVTMANGIVSIRFSKTSAVIDQINYTFNNTGSPQTLDVLAGGNNGGELYWSFGGFGSGFSGYSVISVSPPYFQGVSLVGSNLQFSGAGGTPFANVYLLAATNLVQPMATWQRVATNQFDGSGNCAISISISPVQPLRFYRMEVP